MYQKKYFQFPNLSKGVIDKTVTSYVFLEIA